MTKEGVNVMISTKGTVNRTAVTTGIKGEMGLKTSITMNVKMLEMTTISHMKMIR